jgi:hypothetical protein
MSDIREIEAHMDEFRFLCNKYIVGQEVAGVMVHADTVELSMEGGGRVIFQSGSGPIQISFGEDEPQEPELATEKVQ